MLQFLPLMMEQISLQKKIWYKNKNLKSAYLIDLVHGLILKYYFKKVNYYKLSSTVMKSRYGSNYNFYIDYLIDNKIIELVREYYVGSHSRIYKLSEYVLKNDMLRFENNEKILQKKDKNELTRKEEEDESPIDPIIRKRLISDLFSINIDYESSINYINSIEDQEICLKNQYSIDCIKNKTMFYHFDSYGRLHTNFTILKSHIRKNFLSINDEIVFECDISNSQPLFLTKLISENNINIVERTEFSHFIELTTNGKFYNYIIENSNYKNKKLAKEMTYKVLFGRNNESEYDKVFSELFPSIYKFIKTFKKDHGNYKVLSHELQKLESKFVFQKFIKELYNQSKDIKIITIHDSIICAEKYKEIVTNIFKEKLKEEFSFTKEYIHEKLILNS